MKFFCIFNNFIAPSDDFHALYVFAVLLHVVINSAEHLVFGALAGVKLAYGHKACGARADHHGVAAVGAVYAAANVAQRPVGKPHTKHSYRQKQKKQHRKASRQEDFEHPQQRPLHGGGSG